MGHAKTLSRGHGVPQDFPVALAWLRKAAGQGHAEAQHTLGWLLFHAGGLDVDTQEKVEAVAWLHKSVRQKFTPAFHSLAECYRQSLTIVQLQCNGNDWPGPIGPAFTLFPFLA